MPVRTRNSLSYKQLLNLFSESSKKLDSDLAKSRQEFDKELAESRQKLEADLARSRQEFEERLRINDEQYRKNAEEMRKTDIKIKDLGVQIGGLGNKFGLYNEGLFMPSLIRIIEQDFNCNYYTNNSKIRNNGSSFEIDFWGYSAESCYLIEVKSHLKSEAINQLEKIINLFRVSFPEHSNKKVFGAIAATHYSEEAKKQVTNAGFYFISISDDIAQLNNPNSFEPKVW